MLGNFMIFHLQGVSWWKTLLITLLITQLAGSNSVDNSVDNFLITFLRAVQFSTPYPHLFHRLINRVINRETRPCEKGRNFELTQTKFKLTPCKLKTRATFPAEKIEVINSFSRAIIIIIYYTDPKN